LISEVGCSISDLGNKVVFLDKMSLRPSPLRPIFHISTNSKIGIPTFALKKSEIEIPKSEIPNPASYYCINPKSKFRNPK